MPGYREEEACRPDSTTETYVAAQAARGRQLALGRHAVLRPRRQAARPARDRRSRSSSSARRTRRSRRPRATRSGPTSCCIHVQPDEGVSLAIGAKVPGAGMSIRTGAHGLPRTATSFREALARGLRAADPRRAARRRDALHALGRGRGAVEARGRDRRGVEARSPVLPGLRGRLWGPAAADELVHRDGRSWRRH